MNKARKKTKPARNYSQGHIDMIYNLHVRMLALYERELLCSTHNGIVSGRGAKSETLRTPRDRFEVENCRKCSL